MHSGSTNNKSTCINDLENKSKSEASLDVQFIDYQIPNTVLAPAAPAVSGNISANFNKLFANGCNFIDLAQFWLVVGAQNLSDLILFFTFSNYNSVSS